MCYSQTYTIVQKFRVRLRLLISFKKFVQEPKPLNSMYCLQSVTLHLHLTLKKVKYAHFQCLNTFSSFSICSLMPL